ncbi:hypothetical protein Cni_G06190 [Canna indica]|uniref:Reverse transcriptase domain-containing protein n=1 Tax=Canna indica TaxID=4628 RepID=A0AAQ3JWJ7_9LILI|nr:hypothetical protein Cni_G06190 [Canna indica]
MQFTEEEVITAMNNLGKGKAPRPDGYNLEFYLNFWGIIKNSYIEVLDNLYHNDRLPDSWGQTNLIFIPKRDCPQSIKDYRPIALCNVAYKIFSKVLVNILKPWISTIISKEQSIFVEKRNMHDNIILLSEVVSTIGKSKRKHPYFIMKLDLEKAFDKVS